MSLDNNLYEDFLSEQNRFRFVDVFTRLNIQFIQQTIGSAESGRLGDLYQLYELIESSDTRIKGMINNRRKAVTKNPYHISAGDMEDERSIQAAELVSLQIKRLKWKEYLSVLMDGRVYGVQIHQKIWERVDQFLMLKSLEPVDKSKYGQANYGVGYNISDEQFGKITVNQYYEGSKRIFATELLDANAITIGVDKSARGKYDLQGIMRGLARWYIIKLFAIQSWSQYAEKYGFPVVTATVSDSDLKANSALMKRLLSSIGSNRYGLLLKGMETQIQNAASTANIDVFDRLISICNTEMAIGILGQNLTTDVSGGSFAASKTHLEVLGNLIEDDAEWIDEIVNDQIVTPLVAVNFPELPKELYPTYTTEIPQPIDIEKLSRAFSQASRIVPIPTAHIYSELGIPEPQDDEPTIGGEGSGLLDQIANG